MIFVAVLSFHPSSDGLLIVMASNLRSMAWEVTDWATMPNGAKSAKAGRDFTLLLFFGRLRGSGSYFPMSFQPKKTIELIQHWKDALKRKKQLNEYHPKVGINWDCTLEGPKTTAARGILW